MVLVKYDCFYSFVKRNRSNFLYLLMNLIPDVNDIYNNYLECKLKSVFVLRYDKFVFLNNSLFFYLSHNRNHFSYLK